MNSQSHRVARRTISLLSVLVILILALESDVVTAAYGEHLTAEDFDLHADNDHATGIHWDGDHFWVTDSSDDAIYKYDSSGTHTETISLSGIGALSGITSDGVNIWVSDSTNRRVLRFSPTGTLISSIQLTTGQGGYTPHVPQGVVWDGLYLRVPIDAQNNFDARVFAYTTGGVQVADELFFPASALDGITIHGDLLYTVSFRDDRMTTYTVADGDRASPSSFALAADNADAKGITVQDGRLRVVDTDDDKVYTYEGPDFGDDQDTLESDVLSRRLLATTVSEHDGSTCITSSAGQSTQVNNVSATIHGFCMTGSANELQIELHLSPTSTFADLQQLVRLTGRWGFISSADDAATSALIYDDSRRDDDGANAFTEDVEPLTSSTKLGFATAVKTARSNRCSEPSDGSGFRCSSALLEALTITSSAILFYSLAVENNILTADLPTHPESTTVSRNADYTTATMNWNLYDAVTEYEVQRTTAVQVDVADASRIEYGDPVTYMISGTQAGLNEFLNAGIQSHRTYQYRIRARGVDATTWSAWSDYVFSGAKPTVDLPAPGNLELARDSTSVTASWSAPVGDFDNFTLQRQELILVGGSTFFGNVRSLGDDTWLPADSTMFEDTGILAGQTYEYRVAAVLDDQVGVYTDWFRVGPVNASLGPAPANFRRLEGLEAGQRVFDARYEFWLGWDEVGRADDYEVQVQTFGLTGGKSLKTSIVTDPTFFHTAFSRVGLRVRARSAVDADTCRAADDNRCLTDWTAWADVGFTPITTVGEPVIIDPTSMDASTMELRANLEEVLEATVGPIGTTVNTGLVIEFLVLVAALVIASVSIGISWQRGMAPVGVGMGCAIFILILFVGYRLLDTSVAWPVGAQALVVVTGFVALGRQFGVLR